MKSTCAFIAFLMTLSGCTSGQAPNRDTATEAPSIERLSPDQFLARYTEDAVVLDVRTPAEYASGHLEGALNIDVNGAEFRNRIAGLDSNRTYYLYCRSGNRSQRAAEIMREAGFTSVYNIGGLANLERAGAPVTKP